MRSRLQLLALLVGFGLFAFLVIEIGGPTILRDLRTIGWGLALVIALEFVVDGLNTWGWRQTFAPSERIIPFSVLYLIRLAGTAFNQILPSASVGGESVKADLLRPYLSIQSSLASVITARLAHGIAQAGFVTAGFALGFSRLDLPSEISTALIAALCIATIGIASFLWLQRRGLFASVSEVGRVLHMPEKWIARLHRATASLDKSIRDLHINRPTDLAISVAWHFAALLIGVFQIYILLSGLGLATDLGTCLIIEAFSMMLQLALFLVPAGIGVQEGGKVFIFKLLRLPESAGLSVGIAFRLTQLTGIAAGLLSYGYLQWTQSSRHQLHVDEPPKLSSPESMEPPLSQPGERAGSASADLR